MPKKKINTKSTRRTKSITKEMIGTGFEEYEDAFAAAFEPGKAAVLRARAAVIRAIRITLADWKGTRFGKASQLKIKPARLDLLLKPESVSKFSLSDLIKIAVRAGLSPSIRFEPSTPTKRARAVKNKPAH